MIPTFITWHGHLPLHQLVPLEHLLLLLLWSGRRGQHACYLRRSLAELAACPITELLVELWTCITEPCCSLLLIWSKTCSSASEERSHIHWERVSVRDPQLTGLCRTDGFLHWQEMRGGLHQIHTRFRESINMNYGHLRISNNNSFSSYFFELTWDTEPPAIMFWLARCWLAHWAEAAALDCTELKGDIWRCWGLCIIPCGGGPPVGDVKPPGVGNCWVIWTVPRCYKINQINLLCAVNGIMSWTWSCLSFKVSRKNPMLKKSILGG